MDVTGSVVPGDAIAASLGTSAERIRRSHRHPPVFTVVGWTGEVATADWRWEGTPPRTVWAALAHHPDLTARTGIVVHSVLATVDDAVRELASTRGHPSPSARGASMTAVVDGHELSFEVTSAPGVVVATHATAWGTLVVEAIDVTADDLVLQRVVDLEPFIAGRAARVEHRRHRV